MTSTIGLVLDLIIVAMLVITTIIGIKKGFIKSILALFSWVVCIIVAIFLARHVANGLNHIYNFDALIGSGIEKALIKNNAYFSTLASSYSSTEMPDLGILGQLTKVVFKNAHGYSEKATIANVVGNSLGRICMIIISGVLVFIILKIILALLNRLFDNITRIKVLGVLNKVLGGVFGFIKSACIIVMFNIVLVFLTLLPPVNKAVKPIVKENTYIERVVYNVTDKVIENKVIKGGMLQDWLSDLWDKK